MSKLQHVEKTQSASKAPFETLSRNGNLIWKNCLLNITYKNAKQKFIKQKKNLRVRYKKEKT